MSDQVFYDGACALCHRFVRFLVKRDAGGALFRYAPLQGATFRAAAAGRGPFPDSVVLKTADGRFLVKSGAVLQALDRIGGGWRPAVRALWNVPAPIRDAVYDLVAFLRRRLLSPPADACPVIPEALRRRFDP
jgi:predicted DCC family thiol-disulfide oxidoreductase YuxK